MAESKKVGDSVGIKETRIVGKIAERRININDEMYYRVTFAKGDEMHERWLREDEIESASGQGA